MPCHFLRFLFLVHFSRLARLLLFPPNAVRRECAPAALPAERVAE